MANFLLVSAQDFLRFIDYCKSVAWLLGPSVLDTILQSKFGRPVAMVGFMDGAK